MARRVNKKFLTILSLIIMGGLIALVALPKLLHRQDTKLLWERADKQAALAREQKTPEAYKAAKELYYKAYKADSGNVEGIVKFGDLLHESVRFDIEDIRKDLQMWDQALQIDPRYVPALERIMNAFIEGNRILPSADGFKVLSEKAGALAKVQPSNLRAQAYEQVGIVGAWLSASPIKESDVEDSIKKLIQLCKQIPDEVDLPWYVAKGSLRLAYNRATANNITDARDLRDQAQTVMEDAMKARPNNAGLAYRYYRIQVDLGDPKLTGDAQARQSQRLEKLLENARSLAKPTDDDYVEINVSVAELQRQHGKAAEAEKIVADLLKERPDDQQVRFAMAHLWKLNPEKRPQAIALLSQPLGDDANRNGFRALLNRELEFRRLTELADLRLMSYDDTPEKDRPALREAIEQSYRQAVGLQTEPDNPTLLKLKGKIYLLDNDRQSTYEAIRAMRAAYDKLDQRQILDGELTYQLARLYLIVGETGQYKTLLQRLLDVRPNFHPARKDLVRLLLRDRFYEEAKKHIDYLDQNLKDDQETLRLRLAYLLGTNDIKTVQGMVNSMGEATPQQSVIKATALMVCNENDRAEKLLLPLVTQESKDNFDQTNATQTLSRLYFKLGRKEEAGKIADDVLSKKPKDRVFRLLSLAAHGKATPEELAKYRDELNLEINDPIVRELDNYWSARQQGKPAAELEKMLVQLDQRNPNDGKIIETLFNHGIDFGNFTLAADAAERLKKLNWDQADGLYFQTRLYIARRDGENAMRTASAMARLLPEFSRTWVLMGQAQELNHQYESAVSSFTKALDMQLENFEALRGLVECQIELRQYNEARKLLARGVRSQNPDYFVEVTKRLEEFSGDPRKVTSDREDDLKRNPENLGVWLALIDNYVRVSDNASKSDPKVAEEFLGKAEAKLKEALAKWPDESSIYSRLADVENHAKKPDEGLKLLETLAARDKWKDKPEPQLMLASYYMSLTPAPGSDAQASMAINIAHAEAALQAAQAKAKAPANLAISQRIIDFYLQTNQMDKAVAMLKEMLATTNEPSLRQRLIELQVATGKTQEAEAMLQSALQSKPDDVWLISLMGFVRMSEKNYQSAADYFDRAIKLKPDDARTFYWRGVLRNTIGDSAAAMADFEQARNLAPANVDYHVALADLYASRNQFNPVVQELEAALTIAPGRNDLRVRLLQVHLDQKNWPSAERILDEVKKNPELAKIPVWWKLESQMWQMRAEPLKALDAIEQALKLDAKDQDAIQNLLKILIDSHNAEGYRRVIILTDTFLKDQQGRGPWWVHNARAVAYFNLKKPNEASEEFDKALFAVDAYANPPVPVDPATGRPAREPTDVEIARYGVAADMYADGLVKSMLITIGPKLTDDKLQQRRATRWEIERTQVYLAKKDWKTLVELLDGLLEPKRFGDFKDYQQMRILRVSGQAYPAASGTIPGTYEKGIALCQKYIERLQERNAPPYTQVEALNNLASLIAENPKGANPQEAVQYSKKAFDIMKDNNAFYPSIADTHGWILVLNGKLEEGIDVLRTATAAEYGDRIPAEAFYHLGEAYLKKSLNEEALTNLQRAVQVFDDSVRRGVFVDPDLKTKATAAIARAKNKTAAAINP